MALAFPGRYLMCAFGAEDCKNRCQLKHSQVEKKGNLERKKIAISSLFPLGRAGKKDVENQMQNSVSQGPQGFKVFIATTSVEQTYYLYYTTQLR